MELKEQEVSLRKQERVRRRHAHGESTLQQHCWSFMPTTTLKLREIFLSWVWNVFPSAFLLLRSTFDFYLGWTTKHHCVFCFKEWLAVKWTKRSQRWHVRCGCSTWWVRSFIIVHFSLFYSCLQKKKFETRVHINCFHILFFSSTACVCVCRALYW